MWSLSLNTMYSTRPSCDDVRWKNAYLRRGSGVNDEGIACFVRLLQTFWRQVRRRITCLHIRWLTTGHWNPKKWNADEGGLLESRLWNNPDLGEVTQVDCKLSWPGKCLKQLVFHLPSNFYCLYSNYLFSTPFLSTPKTTWQTSNGLRLVFKHWLKVFVQSFCLLFIITKEIVVTFILTGSWPPSSVYLFCFLITIEHMGCQIIVGEKKLPQKLYLTHHFIHNMLS